MCDNFHSHEDQSKRRCLDNVFQSVRWSYSSIMYELYQTRSNFEFRFPTMLHFQLTFQGNLFQENEKFKE